MSIAFLERAGKPSLAYRSQAGDASLPVVLFLGGFRSDMEGTKAEFLSRICGFRNQGFVRFDYTGHGSSHGVFEEGTIGSWLEDALDIFDTLTSGPVLVIGSSMGGWIGLLLAMARKDRVCGFIGLAAAPDFTREIADRISPQQARQLQEEGAFPLFNDYGAPYHITRNLIEEGERHCLLGGPVSLSCPVRLIQGKLDSDVPWEKALQIEAAVTGDDKKVILLDDADHRLSREGDLAVLERLVIELS